MNNNNNLMETFYLETPSLERKNEIIDYINETKCKRPTDKFSIKIEIN